MAGNGFCVLSDYSSICNIRIIKNINEITFQHFKQDSALKSDTWYLSQIQNRKLIFFEENIFIF